ncbi:peptidoglycan/LPS O-acetylase OafA/YrhL [Inhella inkyongensis]|uniref:Peptidoglycan/LPS O-acetylase OafA/YrhL n=1 Tax=Inhella inkyongensis TaxID=392593 RepID=A0A840S5A0_9BURK|nr:acyltransferase family protein [Inhella inkyongensis]MBB5203994.1 peptidoglycan/LPS O-acetylase OafA/YrhL [Inhella inkyongensis]
MVLNFRPEVQGLRALAVLLVVLYHAGFPGLRAGFVGVDVFFVISGYLITALLQAEYAQTGRIVLSAFFARRIKRLLPAALAVLVVVGSVGVWLYPPGEQAEYLSTLRAAGLYVSNAWLAARSLNYFAPASAENPLLHTWSLAVEEQFYLVWPLLTLWALGWRKPAAPWRRPLMLLILGAVSLAACWYFTVKVQPWAFFLTPMRAWEFAIGAWLVGKRAEGWQATVGAVAGLGLVLGSAALMPSAAVYPGLWAVGPALGAALLLWSLAGEQSANWLRRPLSAQPLVILGDLSYSLYLWHWPVLVALAVLWPNPDGVQRGLALLLALACAAVSLYGIENPIRRRAMASRWVLALGAVATLLMLALSNWAMHRAAQHGDDGLAHIEAAASDRPRLYALNCHQFFFDERPAPCYFGAAASAPVVALVGDSHAAQWFPALEGLALREGWKLVTMTKASCPIWDLPLHSPPLRRRYWECERWRDGVLVELQRLQPQLILMASANHYGLAEAEQVQGLVRYAQRAQQAAGEAKLAVLRDTPRPGFNPVRCLARAHWRGHQAESSCPISDSDEKVWRERLAEQERRALSTIGLRYVDLSASLCPQRRCELQRNGAWMYSDDQHLSASFASSLDRALELSLRGQALLPLQTGGK